MPADNTVMIGTPATCIRRISIYNIFPGGSVRQMTDGKPGTGLDAQAGVINANDSQNLRSTLISTT